MSPDSQPISERVSLNVIQSVQNVTTAAGCAYTLSVERYKHDGNNPDHLKAIVHEDDPEELQDADTPCGFKAWKVLFAVQIYIFDSDNFNAIKNTVRADVENALTSDRTRGGLAQLTEIKAPQTFTNANDASGILVYAEVQFRHLESDAYSKA